MFGSKPLDTTVPAEVKEEEASAHSPQANPWPPLTECEVSMEDEEEEAKEEEKEGEQEEDSWNLDNPMYEMYPCDSQGQQANSVPKSRTPFSGRITSTTGTQNFRVQPKQVHERYYSLRRRNPDVDYSDITPGKSASICASDSASNYSSPSPVQHSSLTTSQVPPIFRQSQIPAYMPANQAAQTQQQAQPQHPRPQQPLDLEIKQESESPQALPLEPVTCETKPVLLPLAMHEIVLINNMRARGVSRAVGDTVQGKYLLLDHLMQSFNPTVRVQASPDIQVARQTPITEPCILAFKIDHKLIKIETEDSPDQIDRAATYGVDISCKVLLESQDKDIFDMINARN